MAKTIAKTVGATIRALADRHNVTYTPTASDIWAGHVTRLTGDEITLDQTELALLALKRSGHLDRPEMLKLQVKHLREVMPGPASLPCSGTAASSGL